MKRTSIANARMRNIHYLRHAIFQFTVSTVYLSMNSFFFYQAFAAHVRRREEAGMKMGVPMHGHRVLYVFLFMKLIHMLLLVISALKWLYTTLRFHFM